MGLKNFFRCCIPCNRKGRKDNAIASHDGQQQMQRTSAHLLTRPPLTVEHPAGVKNDVATPPKKALMIALRKLENTEWDTVLEGMQDVIQISRCNPGLVKKIMPQIYICCSSLVLNPRLQVSTAGCQMAQELFQTMQCGVGPAFYEIVSSLLRRTCDRNQIVREAANAALDAMVTYIPPLNTISALSYFGVSHRNALVRRATVRLFTVIVKRLGADKVLGPKAESEFKQEVLSATDIFLQDKDEETRHHAEDLMKFLMTSDENFVSVP
jgi:hypothetical protein